MQFDVPYIQIEPTTRCNYTCGFCAGRHMPQQDLDFELFCTVVDRLKNPLHVELQGEGEPLLHPDFFAMVRYLRQKFSDVKISTITNGSLFNEGNIQQILNSGINSLMISLESAEPQTFQAIRGGTLERVKRGTKKLMERKRSHMSTMPTVGFAVTLLRSTCATLDAIADLYDELGLDGGILLQPLQTMQTYRQFYDAEMAANALTKDSVHSVNQIIARSADLREMLATYKQNTHFYSELYASVRTPSCPWLEHGLYLTAGGSFTSCCFIKNVSDYAIGSGETEWQQIAQSRHALLLKLQEGSTPQQCTQCGIAQQMQRSQAAAFTAQTQTQANSCSSPSDKANLSHEQY